MLGALVGLAYQVHTWYDSGMAKVALSIPDPVYEALERERERTQRSRSALVTEALRRWLQASGATPEDEKYVQAYLRVPERSADGAAIAARVAETWEPWE